MKSANIATQAKAVRTISPKPIRRENNALATSTNAPIANIRLIFWSSVKVSDFFHIAIISGPDMVGQYGHKMVIIHRLVHMC